MNEEQVTNNEILNALNELNENTVATNNSIKELQEYFIIKDRDEQQAKATAKKQEEEQKKEQEQLQEQQNKEDASALAEQSARSEAQTETYTELLTNIDNSLQIQNDMIAGQFLTTGIICGVLLLKIFWDRIH